MDKQLLAFLACPICKGELGYDEKSQELICQKDRLAYPLDDGIPVMLTSKARSLDETAKTHSE